ncbi:DUF4145 domain-containing protein [Vallitalea okinawensis]|uniref:DUF4145 domain-containing protein n=1 Tax=Vallitalea okinawensis TaxID=2078660 RepID=UPI001A9A391D|nr:DUF4145 domain-containing protein [Vallitalea okinawensis]
MNCPHCKKDIHLVKTENCCHEIKSQVGYNSGVGCGTASGVCPACNKLIVFYVEGRLMLDDEFCDYYMQEPYDTEQIIYPDNVSNVTLPDEVPPEYKKDFDEAAKVLLLSPKASAALSRRCLQNFLHNHLKIKKRSLASEIEEFICLNNIPSYIAEAVDAVRNIGNFAAHPLKDTNTGEIVDVESGEAEWLLEVLQTLFDFYFVLPKLHMERIEKLNSKLKSLGKPEMKSTSK